MAKLSREEMWLQMLTGSYPRLHGMRKLWGALPSPPPVDAWVAHFDERRPHGRRP
jgi:hypothetical protein